MLSRKRCPPFCQSNCEVQHHKLILCLLNLQENDKKSLEKFKKVVSRYQDLDPEDPIPDPLREYRYPLMHWAGVLGKLSAVEHLLEIGHPANLKSSDKSEGTMHRVVLCITSTMRTYKLDHIIKRFKSLVDILYDALFITDDNGNTPLHSCAVYIAELNNQFQLSFYKAALEIMIDKVLEVEGKQHASIGMLNMQNKEGNTVLHILSNGKQPECLELATKLLESNVNTSLKNADDKTAHGIACSSCKKLAKLIKHYERKHKHRNEEEMLSELVSSSAEEKDSPSICFNTKPVNIDHSMVSSTSREEMNLVSENIMSCQQETSSPLASQMQPSAKKRRMMTKVKPTLIKSGDNDFLNREGPSVDDVSSDENTPLTEISQVRESSPGIQLGLISDEEHNEFIRPNLTKLLKQVGQEGTVLELMQKNEKDLQEKIGTSEKKITDFRAERNEYLADKKRLVEEVATKKNELKALINELEAKNDLIESLRKTLEEEEAVLTNLNNELVIYNKISKCLSDS